MINRKRLTPTLLQAWLLAGLLLATQALGLAHRVAHGGGAGTAPAAAVVAAAKAFADGHEAGSPECRLIDQLAHGDLLCADAPALPLPLFVQAALPALAHASQPALPAGAYQARAPPRG